MMEVYQVLYEHQLFIGQQVLLKWLENWGRNLRHKHSPYG